jgi:hypothetical protein
MRFLTKLLLVLALLLPSAALAEPGRRHRVSVYNYEGYQGAIHHTGPLSLPPGRGLSPCFPYGCGGTEGPYRNPEVRAESDKPVCYYDTKGTLFFEKAGSHCPYQFADYQKMVQDQNVRRVERRRQEWLRQQNLLRVEERRQEWLRQQNK